VAKPNYQYEKRQKELAKKNKKAEKLRQKAADSAAPAEEVRPTDTVNLPGR